MTVYVIGMHRSGTSVVARLLSELGLNLGSDEDLIKTNKANLGGFYERSDIVGVNTDFTRNNGLDWRTLPEIERTADPRGVDEYARSIEATLATLKSNDIDVVKDPRLSVLLPYWRSRARSMEAIVCVRHPNAVAASLARRNGLRETYSVALWEQYTLAALQNTRRLKRSVVVYEQMLADPRAALMKIIADLPSLNERKFSEEAIQSALHAIIPDMDHSTDTDSDFDCPTDLSALYSRILNGDISVSLKGGIGAVSGEVIRLEAAHQRAKATIGHLKGDQAATQAEITALKAAVDTRDKAIETAVIAFGLKDQPIPGAQDDGEAQIERLKLASFQQPNGARPFDGANSSWEALLRHSDALLHSYRGEVEALHKRSTQDTLKLIDLEVGLARAAAATDIAESRVRQLEALEQDLPELRERNRDLQANIRELTSQLESRQASLDTMLAERTTLSDKLHEERKSLVTAQTEIHNLQACVEASDAELEQAHGQLSQRQRELESARDALTISRDNENDLQHRLTNTQTELNKRAASASVEDMAALESALQDMSAAKAAADALAEQARHETARLRREVETAQAAMARAEAEFTAGLAARDDDLREVEDELSHAKQGLEAAEMRAAEAHQNDSARQSRLAQTEEYAAQSAAEAKALRHEIDALKRASDRSVEGLSQTIRSLNAELTQADRRTEEALKRSRTAAQDLHTQKDAWVAVMRHASTIDQLLSPRLGRFAVPVRTIRNQLVKMRSIAVQAHATAKGKLK